MTKTNRFVLNTKLSEKDIHDKAVLAPNEYLHKSNNSRQYYSALYKSGFSTRPTSCRESLSAYISSRYKEKEDLPESIFITLPMYFQYAFPNKPSPVETFRGNLELVDKKNYSNGTVYYCQAEAQLGDELITFYPRGKEKECQFSIRMDDIKEQFDRAYKKEVADDVLKKGLKGIYKGLNSLANIEDSVRVRRTLVEFVEYKQISTVAYNSNSYNNEKTISVSKPMGIISLKLTPSPVWFRSLALLSYYLLPFRHCLSTSGSIEKSLSSSCMPKLLNNKKISELFSKDDSSWKVSSGFLNSFPSTYGEFKFSNDLKAKKFEEIKKNLPNINMEYIKSVEF